MSREFDGSNAAFFGKFGERLSGWFRSSRRDIGQSHADRGNRLFVFDFCGGRKQALIGGCVLNDDLGLKTCPPSIYSVISVDRVFCP